MAAPQYDDFDDAPDDAFEPTDLDIGYEDDYPEDYDDGDPDSGLTWQEPDDHYYEACDWGDHYVQYD